MQDWRLWASNHLVEYVCPMLYTNVSNDLNYWLDQKLTEKQEMIFFM